MAIFPGSAIPSAASDYTIDQSLRFNRDDASYLSKTFGSDGNRTTWTISTWVKIADTTNQNPIVGVAPDANNAFTIALTPNLDFYNYVSGSGYVWRKKSTAVYRDVGAWMHVVAVLDTTNGTEEDRARLYVNGVRITDWAVDSDPSASYASTWWMDASYSHRIGNEASSASFKNGNYLAEFYFIDGQALDADSFGETDEDTNQWKPIDASALTFGTNGFYLKFQDSSALGDDSSGNTNDFTATNLVASDKVLDSPTNNFCTFNPLESAASGHALSFQEGNLQTTTINGNMCSTVGFGTGGGKWYYEYLWVSSSYSDFSESITVQKDGIPMQNCFAVGMLLYFQDGTTRVDGVSGTGFAAQIPVGSIIQVNLDLEAGTLQWGNDDTYITAETLPASVGGWRIGGVQSAGSGATQVIVANYGQDSSFAGNKTAQGNQDENGIGDFYYEVPAGFLTPCSSNLPDPEITFPGDYFNSVLYDGNGVSGQTISGVGFQPDFSWIKSRTMSQSSALVDVLRGSVSVRYDLESNATVAQDAVSTDKVGVLNSDGFTLIGGSGQVNNATATYVAWNWLGGGAAVTNTAGTLDSEVSANTTAGFSVCTYDGNETSGATFGHGLAEAPTLVIVKKVADTGGWITGFNAGSTHTGFKRPLRLDTDADQAGYDDGGYFDQTNPSATVVTLGNYGDTNKGTGMIAYCFHSVEGYSRVGSYQGNGNADGAFVYTGFTPEYFMIKSVDANGSWAIHDSARTPYNGDSATLLADAVDVEATGSGSAYLVDIVSNGFKLRATGSSQNTSAITYLYLAFAKSPLKYANAR